MVIGDMNKGPWLALVAIVACGGGKDECTQIKDKVRPVIEAMIRDAGKQMPPEIESDLQEMCATPTDDEGRTFHSCVVAASSQPEVAACLAPLFESYRGGGSGAAAARDKRLAELQHQREELDKKLAETQAVISDAALAVASDAGGTGSGGSNSSGGGSGAGVVAPPTPVDPTKLPLIAVTDHDRGDETQVLAAGADADALVIGLWPASQPMLAAWQGKSITGQLVAPSRIAAAKSIAAAVGIAPRPILARTHSAAVNLEFAKAPQADLLRVIADTLHVNIVVKPGSYPDLDIVCRYLPATDVLAAIAAFDDLAVVRDGSIRYLVPRGSKLPKLVAAREVIDLSITGGTAQQAIAAMAAVATVPVRSCDTKPIDLHLRRVTVADAIRALELIGTTFDTTSRCPIADLGTLGASPAVTAIAAAGIHRVAIVVSGGVPALVKKAAEIEIGASYVTIHGKTIEPVNHFSLPPDDELDYAAWLSRLHRAQAVFREGSRWFARVETTDGRTITIDSDKNLGKPVDLRAYPPQIGPSGVDLVAGDHHTKKHVPLASK